MYNKIYSKNLNVWKKFYSVKNLRVYCSSAFYMQPFYNKIQKNNNEKCRGKGHMAEIGV